jgi:D-alanine-D-alanine ligase
MAKIADISYSDMIAMILKSADERISGQKQG